MKPGDQRIAIAEAVGMNLVPKGHSEYKPWEPQYFRKARIVYSDDGINCWKMEVPYTGYEKILEQDIKRFKKVKVVEENVITTIPDYPNDLNAMHKAEGSLWNEPEKVEDYMEKLQTVYLKAVGYQGASYWWMAGPRERAEAFLRTIGMWREEGK